MIPDNPLQDLAAMFVRESNLIERVDITQEDILEMLRADVRTGHVGAIIHLDDKAIAQKFLREDDLCLCQKLIIEEQNALCCTKLVSREHIECYRNVNVFVGGRMGSFTDDIPQRMKDLVNQIEAFQGAHQRKKKEIPRDAFPALVETISDFHYTFEMIHPFVDGNGRTGRLLVWFLFRFLGLSPFVFTDHDKFYTYYPAFDSAAKMRTYFLRRYKS